MAPRTPSSKGPKAKTVTSHARVPQQMRIISGQCRRTSLPVIDADGLRPTSDRIRGTVFNWLGHGLTSWRYADIFAGTGVPDFEAASCGATHVTLVENHAQAVCALYVVRDKLGARMVDVVSGDAFAWFAHQPDVALDAVFIGPPFAQDWTLHALEVAVRAVRPDGVVYVEAAQQPADVSAGSYGGEPAADIRLPAGPVLHKHLRVGTVHTHLLLRKNG